MRSPLSDRSYGFSSIRFPANITNPALIDSTNAASVATGYALGEIKLHLSFLHRISTPAAIATLFWYLSFAFGAYVQRQYLTATRTLHLLLLLNMKAPDKPFDIPLISLQFMEKLLRRFIWEKSIEIIFLPWKEGIEIHLSPLLPFEIGVWRLIVLLFHKASLLYRTAPLFCQPIPLNT